MKRICIGYVDKENNARDCGNEFEPTGRVQKRCVDCKKLHVSPINRKNGGGKPASEGKMSKPRKCRGGSLCPPGSEKPGKEATIEDVVDQIKRLSSQSVRQELVPFITTAKEALAEIEARLS